MLNNKSFLRKTLRQEQSSSLESSSIISCISVSEIYEHCLVLNNQDVTHHIFKLAGLENHWFLEMVKFLSKSNKLLRPVKELQNFRKQCDMKQEDNILERQADVKRTKGRFCINS
uniref:Uncharacterized protein n=1 Tax=Tanacetum cinerariifolium TaxID=118510 RepID=A0A699H1F1_TANCI|nr:hypothetical protein [Tanacetum cinerariifolium]